VATNSTSTPPTTAIDASGNVLMVGNFSGTIAFGGTTLSSVGDTDIFLAKWNPTTSTWMWAVRAGGTGSDFGGGVAVSGNSVYITGSIWSGANAVVAGTTLAGAGGQDIVLAKYTDNGTSAIGNWAVSAGGSANDYSNGVAVSGSSVYIAGVYVSGTGAVIVGTSLSGLGADEAYVAKYTDNGTSATNGWAASAGGIYNDYINGLAVSGNSVHPVSTRALATRALAGSCLTGPAAGTCS
jgi:hypothetical protein